MRHKDIDGVQKNKNRRKVAADRIIAPAIIQKRNMDSIARPVVRRARLVAPKVTWTLVRQQGWKQKFGFPARHTYARFLLPVTLGIAVIAFVSGMGVALETTKSKADIEPQGQVAAAESPPVQISGEQFFDTPLNLLNNYFESSKDAKVLAERKEELRQYLQEKKSPFLEVSDTIAEQPHWKLILAISFAESTLGKKCHMFNCSGIGGSDLREYKSFTNWVLDFNRLLDKRYNDWTLDEMCGVYVKPCTHTWLSATQQILDELDDREIQ